MALVCLLIQRTSRQKSPKSRTELSPKDDMLDVYVIG